MIAYAAAVTILNKTISASATWESIGTIPGYAKSFRLKSRDLSSFEYAYSAAPTTYMTANNGEVVASIGNLPGAIYVRGTSGQIIEAELWA